MDCAIPESSAAVSESSERKMININTKPKLPPKARYHAHIGAPKFGHVFIAQDQCFYNQAQGDTFKWDDRKYWHAGSNCGLESKFILNAW